MSDALVEVFDVTKIYTPAPTWLRLLLRSSSKQPVTALDGVSLKVDSGKICAIVGPNGAGKSTMFRILTGLTTPTAGSATIDGLDCTRQSAAVRRIVGFMPADDRSLYLRNTCVENLIFHGRLQGLAPATLRRRIGETLGLVGLSDVRNRVGFALSSGMRARLQLARALLHEPRVLILDEPTGSVDPMGAYELVELIKQVTAERDMAALISSHRLEEVEALHDNVLLLDQGSIVYWGSLDLMRERWEESQLEVEFDSVPAAAAAAELLGRLAGIDTLARTERMLRLTTSRSAGSLLTELDGHLGGITSVRESKLPLRELFARILTTRPEKR